MSDPAEIEIDGKRYRLVPLEEHQEQQPEEKWREPRMPDDYGREIEVRRTGAGNWVPQKLSGFIPETQSRHARWVDSDGQMWLFARIRDDGRKPREVWVNEYSCGLGGAYLSKAGADSQELPTGRVRCIHFREVMEPAGGQQQETA